MKATTIFVLSFFLCLSLIGDNKKGENPQNETSALLKHNTLQGSETQTTTVIICTGKYSKRYHTSPPSKDCRGVKACKGELKKVSLSEAKKMGLTACGYCY